MSVYELEETNVVNFLDYAMEAELMAKESYKEFSDLTRDIELENILSNMSKVCSNHYKMLEEVKKLSVGYHNENILVKLSKTRSWSRPETASNGSTAQVLYEASRHHLDLEENMLFNYRQLKQELGDETGGNLLKELIEDESLHLETMAKIVKHYEETLKP